ncbi:PucR family transcriptional regulator [Brevibacillus borstelensis]|uniref:PucR family transcriptional regulator n=1 Tax=Brevibacillus borstelensis TaxID=45462 RepID=UPI002E1B200F|nr:PucR family transcriptional regulator ligand-binding domain-containing protein [Brevibacillus borstelensis]
MITVRELISVVGWGPNAVLAGESFLDKELIAVTSFDSPDGYKWLHKGEFVLTTGYPFVTDRQTREARLLRLIDELAEIGTPGFAIKLGRYIDELPARVIERANERQMPILSFPMDKAWSDIIIPVAHYINAKQREELDRTHAIYEVFHRHLTRNGSVENLAELLHDILQTPVSIYARTPKWNWHVPAPIEHSPGLEELLTSTGNARMHSQLSRYRDQHLIRWLVHNNRREGAVVLWNVTRELFPWENVALEQTAALLSLEIERHYTVVSTYQRFRNDFLQLLVSGKEQSTDLLIRKAEELDWELADRYVAAVMQATAGSASDMKAWSEHEAVLKTIRNHWETHRPPILCGLDREHRILLLFPVQADTVVQPSEELLASLEMLIQKNRQRSMSIGIGRSYPGLGGIAQSYHEAVISCRAAREGAPPNSVAGAKSALTIRQFSSLGIERILFAESPDQEARQLADECLSALAEYDRERNGQLIDTLRMFLACDGNHAEAAKKLYVHKNTVKYRLQIIRDLTGLHPEKGHDQLLFRIALTAYKDSPVV